MFSEVILASLCEILLHQIYLKIKKEEYIINYIYYIFIIYYYNNKLLKNFQRFRKSSSYCVVEICYPEFIV